MALLWLARQPFFAIRAITVDGDIARNSVSTIRANAAPQLAGNFLTIDLAAVRRAFESVPWVRQAVVQRVWPNRLRVRLRGASAGRDLGRATAATTSSSTASAKSSRPTSATSRTTTCRRSRAPTAARRTCWRCSAGSRPALAPLGARVDTLALSGRGSWQATLDSGAVVELGRGSDDEVLARAARFVATLPPGDRRATSARSNTPTCATTTATRCA